MGHVENLDGAPQVIEIDGFRVLGLSSDDADFYRNYPEEKRKKVMRKVSKEPACPPPPPGDVDGFSATCIDNSKLTGRYTSRPNAGSPVPHRTH